MKSVTSSVMITSLLAASLLAFCAPQPAYAAEYVACANVAQDANTLYRLSARCVCGGPGLGPRLPS